MRASRAYFLGGNADDSSGRGMKFSSTLYLNLLHKKVKKALLAHVARTPRTSGLTWKLRISYEALWHPLVPINVNTILCGGRGRINTEAFGAHCKSSTFQYIGTPHQEYVKVRGKKSHTQRHYRSKLVRWEKAYNGGRYKK